MKNKLTDLNNILFEQLERLTDGDLKAEAIGVEVDRAEAIVAVADRIVENARLQLDGMKLIAEHGAALQKHLPAITSSIGLVALAPPTGDAKR